LFAETLAQELTFRFLASFYKQGSYLKICSLGLPNDERIATQAKINQSVYSQYSNQENKG
jgi:hypothetical protein